MHVTYRKGQKVVGLGRYGATWKSRPVGTVTKRHGDWVRVQWDDCCVEDDMLAEWLRPAR
jgi:hypothetical protein